MAIKMIPPPAGGIDVVSQSLSRLAQARPEAALGVAARSPEPLRVVEPLKVYVISLASLETNNPLPAAKPVSWRYVVAAGDEPASAVETTLGDNESIRFTSAQHGARVKKFVNAVHLAEVELGGDAKGEWELRYLRIPSLHVDAVWLHEEKTDDDRLIPIITPFSPFQSETIYTRSEFFDQLRKQALERMKERPEDSAPDPLEPDRRSRD